MYSNIKKVVSQIVIVCLCNWKQFKSGVCQGQMFAINNTLNIHTFTLLYSNT